MQYNSACRFHLLTGELRLKERSYSTLMRRLSQAGFKKNFVRSALWPDWWDDACEADLALLSDLEIRVARFLGRSLSDVRDPESELAARTYAGAQLRRVRDLNRDRLAAAIHAAMQIAGAVVRNLRRDTAPVMPPRDALSWRDQIERPREAVRLGDILEDVWSRGIPVISIAGLPTPKFQGLAAVVEGRPVIVLGHQHEEPGRSAFIVSHEICHIAEHDCTADSPVVDEEEEVADDAQIERRADAFATRVLVGNNIIPDVNTQDAMELARTAIESERKTGVDASAVIYAWARKTSDYATATKAIKALYRAVGGQKIIRNHFCRNVNIDSANESDSNLLRCVHGGSQ